MNTFITAKFQTSLNKLLVIIFASVVKIIFQDLANKLLKGVYVIVIVNLAGLTTTTV